MLLAILVLLSLLTPAKGADVEHESGIGLLGVGFEGVACKRAMFGAEDFRRVKKAIMGTAI